MEPDVTSDIRDFQPEQRFESSLPRRKPPVTALISAVAISVLALGMFTVVITHLHSRQGGVPRMSGLPSSVTSPLATLMGLSPVPTRMAPVFTLTDQKGNKHSLTEFRGHSVVLEFMDPHCIDICPIVSREFINAYRNLGTDASRIVFVGVNANPYHLSVADVSAFSQEHQLNAIPSWHFFTGSASELTTVWKNYGILVQAPSPNADIVHSSFVFFIGPDGRERFLANPTDYHSANGTAYLPSDDLTSWGQGIALTARSLLPAPP